MEIVIWQIFIKERDIAQDAGAVRELLIFSQTGTTGRVPNDNAVRFPVRVLFAQGAPASFNPQRRGWFRPEFMVGRVLALRGFPQDYLGDGRVKFGGQGNHETHERHERFGRGRYRQGSVLGTSRSTSEVGVSW
jgi:hypothetical protein